MGDRPLAVLGAESEPAASTVAADLRSLRYDVVTFALDRVREWPEASVAVLETTGAFPACARASQEIRRQGGIPILWVVEHGGLDALEDHEGLFDDFVSTPYSRPELDARLRRLHRSRAASGSELIRVGQLEIDVASYRASVTGHPLKLTYMEFELLRYLAARPGRIHTREALLRGVWATTTTGGSGPWTSTFGASEPSSARSTGG